MTVTFAFCLGDITEALTPKYNFAYIDVFYNSTQSRAGATIMAALITIMTLCSTISNVATASRQMFAFARDRGLPFSNYLSQVRVPSSAYALPPSDITITDSLKGATGLGYPTQRRGGLVRCHLPVVLDQPRQQCSFQRHRLPGRRSHPQLLHHLHQLSGCQAIPRKETTECSLESGRLWRSLQCRRCRISCRRICFRIFPAGRPGHDGDNELECSHLWSGGVVLYRILLCLRSLRIHRTCCARQTSRVEIIEWLMNVQSSKTEFTRAANHLVLFTSITRGNE